MSDSRKYRTLPNLKALKNYRKCRTEGSRKSLFDTLFFENKSDQSKEHPNGFVVSRMYRRESNEEPTNGAVHTLDRSRNERPKRKKEKRTYYDDSDVSYYDDKRHRKKHSDGKRRNKQAELDAIIDQIHSNLSCREQLNVSTLLNGMTNHQFGDPAKSNRKKKTHDNKPTDDNYCNGFNKDYDIEMTYDAGDNVILRTKRVHDAKVSFDKGKSRSMFDFFDILDENRDLFEQLRELNGDADNNGKDYYREQSNRMGSNCSVNDATVADVGGHTNGNYVENISYFTAGDMRYVNKENEMTDDSLNDVPNDDYCTIDSLVSTAKRQRVSGRRDRGVWTDTLFEDRNQSTPGRVEGRESGWWRHASSRKSNREQLFRKNPGKLFMSPKTTDLPTEERNPEMRVAVTGETPCQAERLSEYEQYFASLVVDTNPDHPDRSQLYRHQETVSNLVSSRDASGDGELERIQELFPNDSLRLYDPHTTSQKMKGLMRKRSTTAARLQRAFSAKGLRTQPTEGTGPGDGNHTGYQDSPDCASPGTEGTGRGTNGYNGQETGQSRAKRHFIMETPVQFTTGVQSQERHLFLFSDLLLVAKSRSGGNFKLKEKVRVSEMWLSSCLEDVAEVSKSHETSFVMGWPTTNVVASFSCVGTKDLWYNKLAQVIADEKEISPASANIQVSFYDQTTNADICKTVTISSNTNARECIGITLDHLEMRDADVSKFQLWVKTPSDDAPYPLIGHEFPLSIKYNCVRDNMPDCDNNNISNSGVESKCQFILRQDRKVGLTANMAPENGGKKVSKKARKSPIRIHKVFKRSNSKGDSLDGPAPSGILFGHPLSKLYDNNNGSLPKPVMEMLSQIFQKGPFTVGIFRKSANARQVREMREKLDSGCPIDLTNTNITAVAALFKEYLRTLPDALLCSQLYDEWLEIPRLPTVREQISKTLLLCSRLHKSNLLLLQHFFCILHHIARRSSTNMMSASNLAVCVGPSLLWPSSPVLAFTPEDSKQAPSIMEFLIDRFGEIFGEAMLRLMGDAPETDPSRQDSGAEESDSLHSGHSLHSCNGRRDDSSIDSLERDLLEGELSPLPRKDKMSLTNLSRDSGLTMSDTQLYTPDEEESESTSSGHSSADKNMGYSSERVQHYPAPNNPNAIYTAICRRSEKSSPTYEDHENYYATPSREHTRVHITYSTPSYTSAPRMNGSCYPEGTEDIAGGRMNYDEDSIYSIPSADNSCHFQRGDWMRKKSNLRKVSKTNSNEGALTRSTSEESLLNKYNNHDYGVSLSAGGPASGRRSPSEECLRSPTQTEFSEEMSFSRDSAIRRSRSAHYLAEVRREKLKDNSSNDLASPISRSSSQDAMTWLRSKSTPHIQEEGDRSYDSSTLSDDDSTPHISRSNSRGKECSSTSTSCWDNSLQHTDSSNSRNSSFKSERTSSVCTVISAGSCSTLSSIPPSYEEALNRKSLMQQHQYNDTTIREELIKSAKAKQLYQSSLKIYQEGGNYGDIVRASPAHAHDSDEIDCPPPLPPKGDPPPLPPKQRSIRRTSNDSSSRLKHLPPVHVDTQSSPRTHKSKDKATVHKTIIYTNMSPTGVHPKERTVIEVVDRANESNRCEAQTVVSSIEKKNIETQTDDIAYEDEEDLQEDEIDDWQSRPHVTSVHVPDSSHKTRRRGRARRRDSSSSQRSRSVPSRGDNGAVLQSEESESEEAEDWDYVVPNISRFGNLDSELRDEISWSVSQLRSIFGDSLKGAKVHPPPYRPPPMSSGRAPITSYHLGAGDAFSRKSSGTPRRVSNGNSYGEESYV